MKEKLKAQKSEFQLTFSQYYSVAAIVVIWALGILGYYVYQFKKGYAANVTQAHRSKEGDTANVTPEARKLEME